MTEVGVVLRNMDDRSRLMALMPSGARLLHERTVADIEGTAADDCAEPMTGDFRDGRDAGGIDMPLVRRNDGFTDRMRRVAFCGGRNVEQLRLRDAGRMNGGDGKAALCERPCLIEHNGIDARERFKVVCTFDQDAFTRRAADAAEEGERNGHDQRAGTGNHEKDQRAPHPLDPNAVEEQRRDESEKNCADDNARRVPTRKAGDESLNVRFFLGSVFHELQNFLYRALGKDAFDPDTDHTGKIDRTADDLVACAFVNGQTLARQCRGVDRGFAIGDLTVQRNAFSGAHDDRFPERDLGGIDGRFDAVPDNNRVIRANVHELRDGLAALSDGDALEEFSDLIEDHDAGSFSIFADGERADRGDRHEEFFVKNLTAQNAARGTQEYIVAGDQVWNHKHDETPDAGQREKGKRDRQRRGNENAGERPLLLSAHGLTERSGSPARPSSRP